MTLLSFSENKILCNQNNYLQNDQKIQLNKSVKLVKLNYLIKATCSRNLGFNIIL